MKAESSFGVVHSFLSLVCCQHRYGEAAGFNTSLFTSYGLAWSTASGSVSTFHLIVRLTFASSWDEVRSSYSPLELAVTWIGTRALTVACPVFYHRAIHVGHSIALQIDIYFQQGSILLNDRCISTDLIKKVIFLPGFSSPSLILLKCPRI